MWGDSSVTRLGMSLRPKGKPVPDSKDVIGT
jgi:hypothetical protein